MRWAQGQEGRKVVLLRKKALIYRFHAEGTILLPLGLQCLKSWDRGKRRINRSVKVCVCVCKILY